MIRELIQDLLLLATPSITVRGWLICCAGKAKTGNLKGEEVGVVDQVAIVGTADPNLQRANILMRLNRNPVIGDKFSSRHGQKGVLSQLWPDINMPFVAKTGMRYKPFHSLTTHEKQLEISLRCLQI